MTKEDDVIEEIKDELKIVQEILSADRPLDQEMIDAVRQKGKDMLPLQKKLEKLVNA